MLCLTCQLSARLKCRLQSDRETQPANYLVVEIMSIPTATQESFVLLCKVLYGWPPLIQWLKFDKDLPPLL